MFAKACPDTRAAGRPDCDWHLGGSSNHPGADLTRDDRVSALSVDVSDDNVCTRMFFVCVVLLVVISARPAGGGCWSREKSGIVQE